MSAEIDPVGDCQRLLQEENTRLRETLNNLRERLKEPEEIIRAIRRGEVDALVVEEPAGEQIYWVRKAEALYREMIEDLLPYGIWVCDPNGHARYFSQSFLELTGMPSEEAQGLGWTNRLRPEDAPATVDHWLSCIRTGAAWDRELAILGVDGKYHPVLSRSSPVRDEQGRIVCWVGINLDIENRKKMEDQLRQQAERLAEADRRKDEFLALLGHELRNPLAPIANGLHLLRESGIPAALQSDTLEMMERQVSHLGRLVDDLLDVSRITRGKIQLQTEPIELSKIIDYAVELSTPLIRARRHELSVVVPSEPVVVEADLGRMAQVVSNLLNNAAKFTPEGGWIRLTVQRDEGAIISVEDSGVGLDENLLPHVFDLFVQSRETIDRSQGGLGIGLTLVKNLVEMHAGSVSVHSDGRGCGCRFTVRMPVAEGAAGERRSAAGLRSARRAEGRRVLIVEDNVDTARSLALILKSAGHEVRSVHDGVEALKAAEDFQPEVVLLDIGLPRMNGYEVAQRLRHRGMKLLIIAMTGYGQSADRTRSLEAGIDHHLVKPVDLGKLEELMRQATAEESE